MTILVILHGCAGRLFVSILEKKSNRSIELGQGVMNTDVFVYGEVNKRNADTFGTTFFNCFSIKQRKKTVLKWKDKKCCQHGDQLMTMIIYSTAMFVVEDETLTLLNSF
jgi:hypothetical protein